MWKKMAMLLMIVMILSDDSTSSEEDEEEDEMDRTVNYTTYLEDGINQANANVGPEMGFLWCVCDVSRTGRDRFWH